MIVNKKHYLSSTFVPFDLVYPNVSNPKHHQLRATPAAALEQLVAAAASDGVSLRIVSGYRSYQTQYDLYWGYVATNGQAKADTFSARPGYSEHQSGLTLDIGDANATQCDTDKCFADTAGGQWIAAHAQDYGYIIRYPLGKDAITGYTYEPWHIRYVGVPLAQSIKASGKTMEEYFNVPGGDYQ
jgi:D-alanyl-D-alanine carboxypeptidase